MKEALTFSLCISVVLFLLSWHYKYFIHLSWGLRLGSSGPLWRSWRASPRPSRPAWTCRHLWRVGPRLSDTTFRLLRHVQIFPSGSRTATKMGDMHWCLDVSCFESLRIPISCFDILNTPSCLTLIQSLSFNVSAWMPSSQPGQCQGCDQRPPAGQNLRHWRIRSSRLEAIAII